MEFIKKLKLSNHCKLSVCWSVVLYLWFELNFFLYFVLFVEIPSLHHHHHHSSLFVELLWRRLLLLYKSHIILLKKNFFFCQNGKSAFHRCFCIFFSDERMEWINEWICEFPFNPFTVCSSIKALLFFFFLLILGQ